MNQGGMTIWAAIGVAQMWARQVVGALRFAMTVVPLLWRLQKGRLKIHVLNGEAWMMALGSSGLRAMGFRSRMRVLWWWFARPGRFREELDRVRARQLPAHGQVSTSTKE